MESTKNPENTDSTNLALVLEEFTNEHKIQGKCMNELIISIKYLCDKIDSLENKIQIQKPLSYSIGSQSIQEEIKKGISEINLIASSRLQKPIIKKYQLLLFPEQDAKLFYKIIFGRWFLWLTIMLLLTNLFKFGIHWSDNQKEIKLRLQEHDQKVQSWNYLYLNGGKGIKKLMDTVFTHFPLSQEIR